MNQRHRPATPLLLLIAAAIAFAAGLGYQRYRSAAPDHLLAVQTQQEALIQRLRTDVEQLAERVDTRVSPVMAATPAANPGQPLQEELRRLSSRLTGLEAQLNNLQAAMSAASPDLLAAQAAPNNALFPAIPELDAAQRRLEAEQATQARVDELEQAMQSARPDETRRNALQQRLQDALATGGAESEVSLDNMQCSGDLCRFKLNGQPSGDRNIMLLLMEQAVFPVEASIFTVPDAAGNLTFYVGHGG